MFIHRGRIVGLVSFLELGVTRVKALEERIEATPWGEGRWIVSISPDMGLFFLVSKHSICGVAESGASRRCLKCLKCSYIENPYASQKLEIIWTPAFHSQFANKVQTDNPYALSNKSNAFDCNLRNYPLVILEDLEKSAQQTQNADSSYDMSCNSLKRNKVW